MEQDKLFNPLTPAQRKDDSLRKKVTANLFGISHHTTSDKDSDGLPRPTKRRDARLGGTVSPLARIGRTGAET